MIASHPIAQARPDEPTIDCHEDSEVSLRWLYPEGESVDELREHGQWLVADVDVIQRYLPDEHPEAEAVTLLTEGSV